MTEARSPRGRPRRPDLDQLILGAARELLMARGYAGLSMEATAARAGVGKTSIYRRWPSKAILAFAAVFHPPDIGTGPNTGSLRGDLTAILDEAVRAFTDPAAAQALAGVVTETARDPELARVIRDTFIEAERTWVISILAAARARGEVTTAVDPDALLATLVGAVLYRSLLAGARPDRRFTRTLLDVLVAGVTADAGR